MKTKGKIAYQGRVERKTPKQPQQTYLPEREHRVVRIVAAFNDLTYDKADLPTTTIPDEARRDLVGMIHDPRLDQGSPVSKRIALCCEVSRIIQCLGSPAARSYFHRCLQFV